MNSFDAVLIQDQSVSFKVWAPLKEKMILHIVHPQDHQIEMKKNELGYFHAEVHGQAAGSRYFYRPDDEGDFPDPASAFQPEGVHGPSEVVNHEQFEWQDQDWKGIPLRDYIIYELHIGTFTVEGTFDAAISHLDHLVETGINAIEIMPVSQFPGGRNWGYDGVFPYSVQNTYGGPEGLKRLVDACHQKGIAVILDMVYNHLGPEGNYFSKFAPYFSDTYCTPWGDAINFDLNWCDGVREYFSNNALYWFEHYHIDALRLDAIHMVYDMSAVHIWELIHNKVELLRERLGRPLYLIAESDLNSPRVIQPPSMNGYGFDAQWLDDFHHALYVLLDAKGKERYADFGTLDQLAKAYNDGFVHSGEYVNFRNRKFGRPSTGIPGNKFVVFNMNHDQVGNRVKGERLCMLVDFERTKLGAAAVLLSPYIPMLFMGEEFAVEVPFFYFISHTEKELIEAVREGRKKEFASFASDGEPPDAYDIKTFEASKLPWEQRDQGKHKVMLEWHKRLISLRRSDPLFKNFNKNHTRTTVLHNQGLSILRNNEDATQQVLCLFNYSDEPLEAWMPLSGEVWRKELDSKDRSWLAKEENVLLAPGTVSSGQKLTLAPLSVVVYRTA
jgi:maltooligosyltrehalose trehalohydrolase